MRWGRLLAIPVGVLLLLAGISAALLVRSPGNLRAAPRSAVAAVSGPATHSATVIPTGSAAPQSTQAAKRNATALAAAAAPGTAVTARISIPRISIQNAPIYDRGTDAKGVMLIAPGYAVTHYASSAPFGGGNTVLYGHDDIQGNIFGRLYDLVPGM